jgi:hypothetical protein
VADWHGFARRMKATNLDQSNFQYSQNKSGQQVPFDIPAEIMKCCGENSLGRR